jgi:hypothetical protein
MKIKDFLYFLKQSLFFQILEALNNRPGLTIEYIDQIPSKVLETSWALNCELIGYQGAIYH